jgi:hypothetical protein
MARIGKGQKALDRAQKHRDDIEHLLETMPHWALRGWFLDWAESQLRRDRFYLFSDKEHDVLAKEMSRLRPVDGWGGYTIEELVRAAVTYCRDCCEEDDKLLAILRREKPTELPLWLMLRLVGICRNVAGVSVPYTELETAVRTIAAADGMV